jgi:hypothetical protein
VYHTAPKPDILAVAVHIHTNKQVSRIVLLQQSHIYFISTISWAVNNLYRGGTKNEIMHKINICFISSF